MHTVQCVQNTDSYIQAEAERCRFAESSDILEQVRNRLLTRRRNFVG